MPHLRLIPVVVLLLPFALGGFVQQPAQAGKRHNHHRAAGIDAGRY